MALPIVVTVTEAAMREISPALYGGHVVFFRRSAEELVAAPRLPAELLVVSPDVPGFEAVLDRAREQHAEVVAYVQGMVDEAAMVALLGVRTACTPRELLGRIEAIERELFQKRAAADDLVRRARVAEAVNRFAQGVALKLELPGLVHETVARTRELCDADGASLLLVDPSTGDLCFEEVDGEAQQLRSVRLKAGKGVAGKVAVTAEPLLVRDVAVFASFDRSADQASGFSTGSIIAVPLVFAGDVIGVLEAVRSAEKRPFDEENLRLLQELCPHVTIAVHNARVTEDLRRMQERQLRVNDELEQKVAERSAQIAKAKREWEATIDAINDPIALMDDFTIRRANRAYAQKAGVSVKDVVGKKCYALLAGRSAPCLGCPLASAQRAKGPLRTELRFERRTFAFTAFPLSDNPDERAVVATYKDVTHERSLEGKLRESERLASIGQLASGAAHEINNPLGFVISNLSSLKGVLEDMREDGSDRELFAEGAEMISDSLAGARRVQEIVRSLRQLSKLEVGTGEATTVDGSIKRAMQAELPLQRVDLELRSTAPAAIAALHLDQALGHILKNARQAVGADQRITIRSWDEDDRVVIEVEDEGAGIPPEHLPRIFEPFFTTRAVGQGTGLGLTAAYGLVRRAGGDIEARSELGLGTCVTVFLPRVTIPAEAMERPSAQTAAAAS